MEKKMDNEMETGIIGFIGVIQGLEASFQSVYRDCMV